MVVKELMSTNVCFVKENGLVCDATALMRQYDIGFVPVCSKGGELLGVVTDRDLVTKTHHAEGSDMIYSIADVPITDIMTTDVATLSPDMDIHQAALVFSQKKLHRLPVLQGNRLIGILSVSDLAKKRIYLAEVGDIIGAITMDKYAKIVENS